MSIPAEDGFRIGHIYSLQIKNTTELIPRHAISYVSAKYQSRPVYLILGILFFAAGLYVAYNPEALLLVQSTFGLNEAASVLGPIVIGILLVLAFVGSRRVGIVVASSGGRLFVEARGRQRLALLEQIHADLSAQKPDGFGTPPSASNAVPPGL